AVVADVGGVAGAAGDLLPGLDAGGGDGPGVVLAAAGGLDGGVDPGVRAAAAQVAGHGGGDALAGRGDVAVLGAPGVHERGGLDDEAGRAVAALQPVVGHERPLHGVVQPFCGDDRPALHRRGGEQAARLGCAVDGDRAGPADAGAADRLGAEIGRAHV